MMRHSLQRDTIKNVVCSTTCHPTADWVYNEVRKLIPNISLGTVYRNLSQLSDNYSITTIQDGSVTRYDGNIKPHHHLKCIKCGEIKDINIHNLNLKEKIKSKFDFDPSDIEITVIGKCNKHR
jgi:Fe2+ or Zn2+ uptake regulation protein